MHWVAVHRHQRGYEPFSYDGRFWIRRGRGWLMMRHAMRRFNGTEPALLNDARNRMVRVTFDLRPDPLDDAGRSLT